MNKLVSAQLKQIENAAEQLHNALQSASQQIKTHEEAHERLLQQYWNSGKEMAVLGETAKGYEALQQQNDILRQAQLELKERLGRVLAYSKALISEFR